MRKAHNSKIKIQNSKLTMITADQLKDVLERADALKHYLNIDQKKVEFEEEQLRTQAPDFWEDPKRAEEQIKAKASAKIPLLKIDVFILPSLLFN